MPSCVRGRQVYMPSVYGHNQVQTRRITALRSKEEFVKTLAEEIETHRKNRAAIVFFDSSMELRDFAKQQTFGHGDDANYLLEEIYPQEKDQIVKIRAAQLDAITLATKPFGRGTDFQCMDDTVGALRPTSPSACPCPSSSLSAPPPHRSTCMCDKAKCLFRVWSVCPPSVVALSMRSLLRA